MAKSLSVDLRERVVGAVESGASGGVAVWSERLKRNLVEATASRNG